MKERVTLTIDKDVLAQIDHRVDGREVRNRSHAIENLVLKGLGSNRPKLAFMLAGGKGTRLKPLTDNIPKPLLPFKGKPIIDHTIYLLKKNGIKDIILSIGYMGDKIEEHCGNGEKYGVNIRYLKEEFPLGTAGPLRLGKEYLTDAFVVCNADNLYDVDLIDMFNYHKENEGICTIALKTVEDPTSYGVAIMNGNQIETFVEKPKEYESNLINSGLYIMESKIIDYIPKDVDFSMLEQDVFPKLAQKNKLIGYVFSGQWYDLGTTERLKEAEKEWKGT